MSLVDRHPDWWLAALADPSWGRVVEEVAARWEAGLRRLEAARSEVPLPPDWAAQPAAVAEQGA
eukprot:7985368-Prorocentrum_lima.AAC.1